MSSTQIEFPQITGTRIDSLITGIAVGIVAGVGIGVIATSKDVIPTLAAGCTGVGAGSAIAYFAADYRHTHRRNALATQLQQVEADRTQLQQEVMEERAAAIKLKTELQAVFAQHDPLAEAAAAEVTGLRTELAAAQASIASSASTNVPIVEPAEVQPTMPASDQAATLAIERVEASL